MHSGSFQEYYFAWLHNKACRLCIL